jgi:hypothetical protein
MNPEKLTGATLVDTSDWPRLPEMEALAEQRGVST